MSRSSTSTAVPASHGPSIAGAIRSTDEYAAAFDLEVWKAQQQLQYQAQLRQAKERLERRLHNEVREREQKKLAELEALRQDLETMGLRLQATGETLEKRAAQLGAREAAFSAKRIKVAEQHESYVTRAEEQARRTREEAQIAQATLQTRLQEKDRIILQLQEKLSAAQQEYELLRRRAARHLSEQTDTDGQRLREQECALTLAHAQLNEMQQQLRERTTDAERLASEKGDLQEQVRELRLQLASITRKYHRLSEETQAREWERLRKEQEALEMAKRSQAIHVHREQAYMDPLQRPSGSVSGLQAAGGAQRRELHRASHRSASLSSGELTSGTGGQFYDMLAALKHEVAAGLAAAAHHHHHHSSSTSSRSLPFKIVEKLPTSGTTAPCGQRGADARQPDSGALHSSFGASAPAATAFPAAIAATQELSGIDKDGQSTAPPSESAIAADETSFASVAVVEGEDVVSHLGPERLPSASLPIASHASTTTAAARGVVVDMGDDTSFESAFPRVELQSWNTSLLAGNGADAAIEPLPPARAGTLPPLAPELRGVEYHQKDARGQEMRLAAKPHSLVSPTPEEFVLSREAPAGGVRLPASDPSKTAAARRDMTAFVQQLKLNREKLIETGVYSEQDRVVQEMSEKIRMYEQYLAQQHD